MKSFRILSKKIKITGTGKLLHRHSCTSHLKRKDDKATQRSKARNVPFSKGFRSKLRKLL